MNKNNDKNNFSEEDKPPFFSSWNKLYAFVLLVFASTVFLFYIFTKAFE